MLSLQTLLPAIVSDGALAAATGVALDFCFWKLIGRRIGVVKKSGVSQARSATTILEDLLVRSKDLMRTWP